MCDQPNLFRQLIPIKRRMVKVGGGVLYANHKGTANLVCQDGSSMLLADCLYVPDLGVNLLSARRLCEAGLKGIPPFGGASLSLILFPSHQARNIITKPPIALPHNLSHISPIFSICAIPPSTASTTPSTILQSLLLPSSNIALQVASFLKCGV